MIEDWMYENGVFEKVGALMVKVAVFWILL